MAGLVSAVGLAVMLKAPMHDYAVFLRIAALVTVISSGSPLADESPLDSHTRPVEAVGGIPTTTGSSPSALPDSHHTAFRSPDLPGALLSIPEPVHRARTADSALLQPGHGANGNSGSVTPRQPYAEESSVRTAAPLSPAGLAQGFEASATSSSEGRGVRTNPDKQEYPSSPYSKQLPLSNTNVSPSAVTESPPRQALDREAETNGTSKPTRSVTDD
ncbi:uncharacterized protein V3H82_018660, partial [Fundulus diaphanus]